jgi:hypothetical protein
MPFHSGFSQKCREKHLEFRGGLNSILHNDPAAQMLKRPAGAMSRRPSFLSYMISSGNQFGRSDQHPVPFTDL